MFDMVPENISNGYNVLIFYKKTSSKMAPRRSLGEIDRIDPY